MLAINFGYYCHNPILGYSHKFTFFQNKNHKNKIKDGNVEKAGREIKLQFLEAIQDLIGPHYTQKMEKTMQIQGQMKWLLDEFALKLSPMT